MLRILTYHRIGDPATPAGLHPRLVSATPDEFARHLDLLARRYAPVSMGEVLAAVRGDRALPARAVLITFDDAYRDFLEIAWPLLRARGVPATLFVPTAYPGEPDRAFWWDRLHRSVTSTKHASVDGSPLGPLALGTPELRHRTLTQLQSQLKSLPHPVAMAHVDALATALGDPPGPGRPVLSWEELRSLAAEGVTIGAHSRTHPLLTRLDPGALADEVRGSLDDLRRELGHVPPVFSYPNGAHDDASVEAVRHAGFALAFTQLDGHNDLRRVDPLRLRRTNITRRTTVRILDLRLQRWFTVIDRWRHRERRPRAKPEAASPPAATPFASGLGS